MARQPLGKRWIEHWDAFWHAPGGTLNLALFRIVFAACLWREVSTTRSKSLFAIEDGFHLPYVESLPLYSEPVYGWIHALQYPLIVLIGLGLLMRWSAVLLLLLQGSIFFADQLNFRNHPYFFLLLLFLMLFSPADEALSLKVVVRNLIGGRRWTAGLLGTERPLTFQRMMQIQVCVAYIYAAVHKLHPAFLSGNVLGLMLTRDVFEGSSGRWIERMGPEAAETVRQWLQTPEIVVSAAWATVALELLLPLALLYRRTRAVAIVMGIGFHLSIAAIMGIHTFSYAMIGTYLLFLDPDRLPSILRRRMRVGSTAAEPQPTG